MAIPDDHQLLSQPAFFRRDVVIACQSGLSAGLCLGFPAGIIFWLVLINNSTSSSMVTELMNLFVNNIGPGWVVMLFGTVTWGIVLSRIVDYRRWYLLVLAITAGVFIGQLPMQNGKLDVMIQRFGFPVHIRFGIVLGIAVFSVMVCTGFALGIMLRNWKAAFMLAGSSSVVSVIGTVLVFLFMDQIGIRVGSGNYAMLKVAAGDIMTAAILGGATLGVVFGRYASHSVLPS